MTAEDVRNTGTYAALMAQDGMSIVEARAWKLAAKAHRSGAWREYLDEAKAELVREFEADQVDISEVVKALAGGADNPDAPLSPSEGAAPQAKP